MEGLHYDLSDKIIKSSSILIVDDMEFNQLFLEETLKSVGYHHIKIVSDGQEALNAIQEKAPDIVILDLLMPVMDGYHFCKEVRKNLEMKMLPILVQTSLHKTEQKSLAFKSGATDFISKPVEKEELLARMKVHLERYHWYRRVCESEARMSSELNQAKLMQSSILPSEDYVKRVEEHCGLAIASYFETSSELGGDIWGMQEISNHECAFYMVDFSGHGVGAALNTFRLHTLIRNFHHGYQKTADSTKRLNGQLSSLLPMGQFATMAYVNIDTNLRKLHMTTAASPCPILLRASGQVEKYSGEGFPLGIAKESDYEVQEIDFHPGDTLFLYSDALIETPFSDGRYMDEDALIAWLSQEIKGQRKMDCRALKERLYAHFKNHIANDIEDDLTMLFVQSQR